ncbi:hypothetical protein TWF281_008979 [Arthrobotrys megalospora]
MPRCYKTVTYEIASNLSFRRWILWQASVLHASRAQTQPSVGHIRRSKALLDQYNAIDAALRRYTRGRRVGSMAFRPTADIFIGAEILEYSWGTGYENLVGDEPEVEMLVEDQADVSGLKL